MSERKTPSASDDRLIEVRRVVKDVLKAYKISQEELGMKADVSQSTIHRVLERKVKKWSKKIEKLFNYSKNLLAENAATRLQQRCEQYLEEGGRETLLGDLIFLLTEEQKYHLKTKPSQQAGQENEKQDS